jgi:hypothetical protein
MKTVVSEKHTSVHSLSLFAILALAALAFTPDVSAEVLTIPYGKAHIQSQSLPNGVGYIIQASGTWLWYGGNSNYVADAAFCSWDGGSTWGPWAPAGGALWINMQPVSWLGTTNGSYWLTNTFSPSHVYDYYTIGTGQPLDFFLDDALWYDNSGNLQVSIVAAPSPQVSLIKAVKPSFSNLTINANYQLQVSGDLNTWTNQGSAFTATNSSMVYPQYWDVDNWIKLFFRLQAAP